MGESRVAQWKAGKVTDQCRPFTIRKDPEDHEDKNTGQATYTDNDWNFTFVCGPVLNVSVDV